VVSTFLRLRRRYEPASNDKGYTEFKNAFLDVVSCIMLPMVAKALSHDMDVPQADYVALHQGGMQVAGILSQRSVRR
jgi:hypothetical protein